MKHMKILALILALVMIIPAIVACGGDAKDTTTKAPDTTKAPTGDNTTAGPDDTAAPSDETTVHEHAFKVKSAMNVAPTCTEPGSKYYECECGESYTEPVEATGHSYVVTPDTTGAYEKHACSKCDDVYYTAAGSEEKIEAPAGITFIDYIQYLDFSGANVPTTKKSGSDAMQYVAQDEATGNDYWKMDYAGTDLWWDVNTTNAISRKYIASMDIKFAPGIGNTHLFKLRAQTAEGKALFSPQIVINAEGYIGYYDYTGTPSLEYTPDVNKEQYVMSFPQKFTETKLDDQWHNIAVIVDEIEGTSAFYLDGTLVVAGVPHAFTQTTTDVWPGVNVNSGRMRMVQCIMVDTAAGGVLPETPITLCFDNAKLYNYVKGILD